MPRNINSDVYGYGSEISRTCVDTPFFKIEGICGNMNEKLEIKPENAEIFYTWEYLVPNKQHLVWERNETGNGIDYRSLYVLSIVNLTNQ